MVFELKRILTISYASSTLIRILWWFLSVYIFFIGQFWHTNTCVILQALSLLLLFYFLYEVWLNEIGRVLMSKDLFRPLFTVSLPILSRWFMVAYNSQEICFRLVFILFSPMRLVVTSICLNPLTILFSFNEIKSHTKGRIQ